MTPPDFGVLQGGKSELDEARLSKLQTKLEETFGKLLTLKRDPAPEDISVLEKAVLELRLKDMFGDLIHGADTGNITKKDDVTDTVSVLVAKIEHLMTTVFDDDLERKLETHGRTASAKGAEIIRLPGAEFDGSMGLEMSIDPTSYNN